MVLPGLDPDLPDAAWDALGPEHPQAGLRRLAATGLGATPGGCAPLAGRRSPAAPSRIPAGRIALLRRALLPAAALTDWQARDRRSRSPGCPASIRPISRRKPPPSPRSCARRWNSRARAPRWSRPIARWPDGWRPNCCASASIADDSAGEPLVDTPPAVFLRLLIRAVAEELAPVPLLALLKHPLAAAGPRPARLPRGGAGDWRSPACAARAPPRA